MAEKKYKTQSKSKTRLRCALFLPVCLSIIVITLVALSKVWIDIYEKNQEKKELSKELVALAKKKRY